MCLGSSASSSAHVGQAIAVFAVFSPSQRADAMTCLSHYGLSHAPHQENELLAIM
jgi:hypothetical protein